MPKRRRKQADAGQDRPRSRAGARRAGADTGSASAPPATRKAGHTFAPFALPKPTLTGRQHLMLAIIFVVALALRLTYLVGQAHNNPLFDAPVMDGLVHHQWASSLAQGQPLRGIEGEPYFRAPLYYHVLGLIYKLFGAKVVVGRVLGCLIGSLTCYLIARLGVMLAGFRVGVVAGLIAAVYWPFIYFDAELLTVGLEVLLDVSMLLALLWAARRGLGESGHLRRAWPAFAAAGLLWGLSAITRPNVLAILPGIALGFYWLTAGSNRLRRALLATGITVVGAAVAILPVTMRNVVSGGEFVLIASQGGVNFYIGNNPYNADGYTAVVPFTRPGWWEGFEDTHRIPEQELGRDLSEREVSAYWLRKSREWIAANPGVWIGRLAHKFMLFWTPVEVSNNQPIGFFAHLAGISALFWIGFPVVTTLAAGGLVFIRRQWRAWALPILFLILYMGTVVAFFCPGRYRLPVVPVLMMLAGVACVRVWEHIRSKRFTPVAGAGVLAAGVVVFMVANPTPNPDRRRFARIGEAEGHLILAQHFAWPDDESKPDLSRAREELTRAITLRGDDAYLRWKLGAVLEMAGDIEGAEAAFKKGAALAGKSADPEPLFRYGQFLVRRGQFEDAMRQFELALKMQPTYNEARAGIAAARAGMVDQLRQTLGDRPDDPRLLYQIGTSLLRRGENEEALQHLARGFDLAPDDVNMHYAYSEALKRARRYERAIEVLESTPGLNDRAVVLNQLAWLLATAPDANLRDGTRALELARRARELAGKDISPIADTLAAAYAELGQFDQARATADRARKLAQSEGKSATTLDAINARIALYTQQTPYREPESPAP